MKGSPKIRPERGLGPKGGDPMTGYQARPEELSRFWARVDKRGPDDCWSWLSYTRCGYGSIYFGGKERRAHRVSCLIHGVELPEGLVMDHKCGNTRCVNPAHLRPMTQGQNSMPGLIAIARARKAANDENK